jgi:hypothetical protein
LVRLDRHPDTRLGRGELQDGLVPLMTLTHDKA